MRQALGVSNTRTAAARCANNGPLTRNVFHAQCVGPLKQCVARRDLVLGGYAVIRSWAVNSAAIKHQTPKKLLTCTLRACSLHAPFQARSSLRCKSGFNWGLCIFKRSCSKFAHCDCWSCRSLRRTRPHMKPSNLPLTLAQIAGHFELKASTRLALSYWKVCAFQLFKLAAE